MFGRRATSLTSVLLVLALLSIPAISGQATADIPARNESRPETEFDHSRQAERTALWAEVDGQIDRLGGSLGFDRLSPAVRSALLSVPRHDFVPPQLSDRAYLNRPLPIGHGQTISQPLIVAVMTELLQIEPGDRVFELGTGSGYQAAVLSALDAEVYSVEIVPALGENARRSFDRTGHDAVETRIADGYLGWEEAAPFDAIIVTAAGDHVPPPLIRQLKPGGRMVLPVGGRYQTQQLVLVERDEQGRVRTRELMPVRFVPLTGEH
jgi:protein-L-isoaspartate(D-aspartate) O-methyltransferase